MPQPDAWTLRQKITGVLLRQARLAAGKSLKECGEIVGFSSSALSAIERGKRSISLPELELLAYYLGVSLNELLNDQKPSSSPPAETLPRAELLMLRHRIIGALLRQARFEQDLTQAELAKKVGVSKRRLSQYELGQKPVPIVELEVLAETLGMPLTHFLDEGIGPIGEQQQREKEWQQFVTLPPEVRTFVLQPTNLSYVQLAMQLSAVPADGLRNIAASLLDITL
jgi:transcriptional regulator with XRE-family HTH domain